jgi:hypothetical protein
MSSAELTTYKTGGALSNKDMHPGEYGRVSAWDKNTKNDLALVKDMYGHPPSIVFERPAEKLLKVATTDPPVGHAPPGDPTILHRSCRRNTSTQASHRLLTTRHSCSDRINHPSQKVEMGSTPSGKTGIHHDSKPRLHPDSSGCSSCPLAVGVGGKRSIAQLTARRSRSDRIKRGKREVLFGSRLIRKC